MIVGIGVDVCDLERFGRAVERPRVRDRLFAAAEQSGAVQTLAGRFAAKEALAKALGAPEGLVWTDAIVTKDAGGRPGFALSGTVRGRADALGVTTIHLSITHDAGVAVAMVVCEG